MKPIARKDDLVIQEMGGEILVYDLRTNKVNCLNQTSAMVWQNCDGEKDALEIARSMEKQLGSAVSEDFVWFAVNQLKTASLLENGTSQTNKFEGLSRREAVKKLGMASLIALPIIASLTAPVAAGTGTCPPNTNCDAQSAIRCPGCPCNGNGNCFSNRCDGVCL